MRLRSIFTAVVSVIISLPALAAITGTVINPDGQAVSGAKIAIFAPETVEARRARVAKGSARTPLATATSDSRGNFSVDSPKEPVFDLRVEAASFAPEGTRVLPDEELGAIVLFAAPMQSGTITAAGKPVAGAHVMYGASSEFEVTTDEKGRYSVPDPLKWANRMVVIHPDYAVHDETLGPFSDRKKGLDRTLEGGSSISGHVFAADGTTPIANASISVDGWPLATSAEDGSFKVAHAPKNWTMIEARLDDRVGTRARSTGDVAIKLAKAASVTGIVSDAKTNMPLAGVEVRLFEGGPAMGGMMTAQRSAFTNAKGGYTLAGVAPGMYQLNSMRPGYVTPNVPVSVKAGQAAQKSLYATPRARVIGSVLDDQKRPVAGARVAARPAARDAMMMIGPALRMMGQDGSGFSGPDGRFVLRSVATDADILVDASKKGYPSGHSASLRLAPAERKAGVVITIPHGIALTGKVTDRDGRALSGVAVEAVEATNDGGFGGVRRMVVNLMQMDRNDELVRTGSDGTYTMRVKEGTYDVIFKREGFSTKTVRGESVNASAKPLDVTLEPGVAISGRVARNGVGIEGVNVTVMSPEGSLSSVTGPDGSFRIEDLTPGQMTLMANKREEFIQEMRPVTAPAQNLTIDVRPGGKISGHVVDKSSHKPVSSFQAGISTSRSGGGMVIQTPPILKSFTTDDGSFMLENVPPGPAQVVVSAPGYTTARIPGVTVEEGKPVADLQVELDTGVKLTGRVTGPDGGPLAGVAVRQDAGGPARLIAAMGGGEGSTITDPNGEYTIEALEPGEKTFTYGRQGYLSESRTITLSGSSSRIDVQLTTGVRLTGTVVSEAGGPVTDAVVTAMSASDTGFGPKQARTDGSGSFQIEGVAPGHYTVSAAKSGYTTGTVRDFDAASGAPVRIVMKSGGTIIGHVSGLTPQELQNATVFATSSNGGATGPVDSNGNYKIEGAPSGTVRVAVRTGQMFGASGRTSPTKSIELQPGASVTVDIDFKSGTVVRGRVTRDGQPMANAGVAFFPRGGQSSTNASATTDSSGNYEVTGLDDATYNVQIVDYQRTAPFSTTYEVKGSSTFDIDIKSASLRGRVTDATTGEPLVNARIEIHSTAGEAILSSRAAVTDMNGAFVLDNIARGNYEVKADREGYGHDMKTVVVGDTPEDLEFKLAPSSGVTMTVVDARDNRTLSANVVRVTDAQGRTVDTSPMFRFGGGPEPVKLTLSPGTYNVTVVAMGYATQTVTVVSPSSPTVRMTPGGTLVIRSKNNALLRARLVDANGLSYMRGFGPSTGIFTIDPSPGVTTLQNIAPGTFRLQILGSGDQVTKTVSVTVVDGQPSVVDLD